MDAVQATSAATSPTTTAPTGDTTQAASTSPAAGTQAGSEALSTEATSSSAFTMVSSEVQTMLGGIDPAMAGNELLKMAITLMILEVLLGQDQQQQEAGDMLMAALGMSGGSSSSSTFMYSEVSTTTIEYSAGSYDAQATGGAEAASSEPTTGGTVDVAA